MNTRFVLLQESLEVPPVDRLQRAFRAVKGLVASDAAILANDAFGILVKNLSASDAAALQGALQLEGVGTVAVAEADLPRLPAVKFVRQIDCVPEGFCIYDPIGRRIPVPWAHVLLVVAGRVAHFELREGATRRPSSNIPASSREAMDRLWGAGDRPLPAAVREEENRTSVMEVVLARGAMRFQARPEKLRFDYLGERLTADPLRNLGLLVEDVVRFAPQVRLGRGAASLREEPPREFEYPSKNAFYEELTWLLWQTEREQANPAGGEGR